MNDALGEDIDEGGRESLEALLDTVAKRRSAQHALERYVGESVRLVCSAPGHLDLAERLEWRVNKSVPLNETASFSPERLHQMGPTKWYEIGALSTNDSGLYECLHNTSTLLIAIQLKVKHKRPAIANNRHEATLDLYRNYMFATIGLFTSVFTVTLLALNATNSVSAGDIEDVKGKRNAATSRRTTHTASHAFYTHLAVKEFEKRFARVAALSQQ